MNFYHCEACGNLVASVYDGGGELVCCGAPMDLLVADTVDAAKEKHVPVYTKNGNTIDVTIGSVEHPMTDKHWIEMIAVVQGTKTQIVQLNPEDAPKASFVVEDGEFEIYEFCNLHGLWKAAK